MLSPEELAAMGFAPKEVEKLVHNRQFQVNTRALSAEDFGGKLARIQSITGWNARAVCKSISSFPVFFTYDTQQKVRELAHAVQISEAEAIHMVLRQPSLISNDYAAHIRSIKRAFGRVSVKWLQHVLTSAPGFLSLDHMRMRKKMEDAYPGMTPRKIRAIIYAAPTFPELDHQRLQRDVQLYARLTRLDPAVILGYLLRRPVLGTYSRKRNIASMIAIRNAMRRTGKTVSNKRAMKWYSKEYVHPPYISKGKSENHQHRMEGPLNISQMGQRIERRLHRKIRIRNEKRKR